MQGHPVHNNGARQRHPPTTVREGRQTPPRWPADSGPAPHAASRRPAHPPVHGSGPSSVPVSPPGWSERQYSPAQEMYETQNKTQLLLSTLANLKEIKTKGIN